MLKRIALGLTFALLTTLYYVVMLACKDSLYLNTTSYKAVVVPLILYGIAYVFIIPTSFEFTIAQCPHKMREFLVGLGMQQLDLVVLLMLVESICLVAKEKHTVSVFTIMY